MQSVARVLLLFVLAVGCSKEEAPKKEPAPAPLPARTPALAYMAKPPANPFAYIPPQCYTKTRDERGNAANPCYVCHTKPQAPNFVDDAELQLTWQLPGTSSHNAWDNLFSPAIDRAPPIEDDALLQYVRTSNYRRGDELVLATALGALPEAWDGDADAAWNGYIPDAYYRFDAQGFDRRPDDSKTGWRAFGYAPLPGAFFPTNGSGSDVMMRLAAVLRKDAGGQLNDEVEVINYAIVEALITRRDVAIDVDEVRVGVDLDLDGTLGQARQIKFEPRADGTTRLQYVGKARTLANFPIAIGLFPLDTEFLHSLRYLDVQDGKVVMAARMKELRYARKARWFSYADRKAHAEKELVEQRESATGALEKLWQHDEGISNGQGWLLQGFIEDARGELRPQTHEETLFCAGCHGDIGATSDSMFAFARKLSAPDGGWFHWTQHGLEGLPEPQRNGEYEYEQYLRQNRAGDELRDNDEVRARFFDGTRLRQEAVKELHRDIATLLVPSVPRAMTLNRAYRAVVIEQSFANGRDAVIAPSTRVYREAPNATPTGIARAIVGRSAR